MIHGSLKEGWLNCGGKNQRLWISYIFTKIFTLGSVFIVTHQTCHILHPQLVPQLRAASQNYVIINAGGCLATTGLDVSIQILILAFSGLVLPTIEFVNMIHTPTPNGQRYRHYWLVDPAGSAYVNEPCPHMRTLALAEPSCGL